MSISSRQSFLLFVVVLRVCGLDFGLVGSWLGVLVFLVLLGGLGVCGFGLVCFFFFLTNPLFAPYYVREGKSLQVFFPLEMCFKIQKFPWFLEESFAEVMKGCVCLPVFAVLPSLTVVLVPWLPYLVLCVHLPNSFFQRGMPKKSQRMGDLPLTLFFM